MQFHYKAYSLQEGVRRGRIGANTRTEAIAEVVRRGYKPLYVMPAKPLLSVEELLPSLFRVKTGELVRFTQELATMLSSGGSLLRGLELIKMTTRDRMLRRTIESIQKTLDEGGSFSAALACHPTVFSPLVVSVIQAGEFAGRLPTALQQIADALAQEHEVKQRALQTLMYPIAVIGLSVITLVVLMTVALPPLMLVFEQMGAKVPLTTRLAIALLAGVKGNFLPIIFGLLGFTGLVVFLQRYPRVRYRLDAAKLRVPLFGGLIVVSEIARASRTVSMLLTAGVALATALNLAASGCRNLVVQRAFKDGEETLFTGHPLSTAMRRHPVLPPTYVELIVIGEESNSLPRTMKDAADAYQKQLEQRLDKLLKMLEPASTVIVGGIVGFIAFSMFTPIYSGLKAIP